MSHLARTTARTAADTLADLTDVDLNFFCGLIERRAGIHLTTTKRDLVRTRLRSRVIALDLDTYADYRAYLVDLPNGDPEWQIFTNALTTNKTDFFREPRHFEYLVKDILPEWLRGGQRTFTVWSAACSTGEEPYTLAMVLERHLPADRDFKILASDLDTDVLASAENAVYNKIKLPEIPPEYQTTSLDIGQREATGWFRIKPALREKVVFKPHNLIDKTVPGTGVFDLVLCRNVLIYFSPATIQFVQAKLHAAARPGGHLFIGHSESLQSLKHEWESRGPAIYRRGVKS